MLPRRATRRTLAVARGDEPADLVIQGGRVFVPGTREWIATDLAIADGVIAGWGRRDAAEVVDVAGASLTAGFVDPHMHLESTKLWADEFVRAVMPHGTTAVAADPHEIANVFGVPGVVALMEAVRDLPFTFGICASSCVPASPFESPAAVLNHTELVELLEKHGAIGIAEVMDFPGVIRGDSEVLAKIAAAGSRRVDGHAPGIRGRQLDAYLVAGVESDHECTEVDEADEKRRKGMWIFVREGSASRNLAELVPTVLSHGTVRIALCTDDREPDTLLHEGHINDCVRLAVAAGVPVEDALVLATSNPADYHRFDHLGWLAPGYQADVLCFDDLATFEPARVWQAGRLVAAAGEIIPGVVPSVGAPEWMFHSVHLENPPGPGAFELIAPPGGKARVIGVESRSLSTKDLVVDVTDPAQDVARIGVVERHRQTGRIGLGYVSGFGLVRGAIASTVAHDAHNCMVVGARDASGAAEMAAAVARLAAIGGGQVAVLDGRVIGEVRLPIGGLMSDKDATTVAREVEELSAVVSDRLGLSIEAPFMQLSFLGLTVIPELRMTDRGLFDVNSFSLVDISVP
jgi:adenine deaminase